MTTCKAMYDRLLPLLRQHAICRRSMGKQDRFRILEGISLEALFNITNLEITPFPYSQGDSGLEGKTLSSPPFLKFEHTSSGGSAG